MTFAICAPVTSPAPARAGSPSSSFTQATAVASAVAAAGDIACSMLFWSHADVSQSAASAAGSAPPVTKPK